LKIIVDLSAVAQVAGEIASLMAILPAGMPLVVNNPAASAPIATPLPAFGTFFSHCYNGEHQSPNRKLCKAPCSLVIARLPTKPPTKRDHCAANLGNDVEHGCAKLNASGLYETDCHGWIMAPDTSPICINKSCKGQPKA